MKEFFYMDGYYFYVWTSYGLAAIILLFNIVAPVMRHKRVLRDITRKLRREEAE